jgi:signal transduction histidine kinase
MPGILQRPFLTTLRNPEAEALEMLAVHTPEILEIWQERLRELNLDANVLIPEGIDFRRFARDLRGSGEEALEDDIRDFGAKLAQRCDRLDYAVAAFDGLFAASLPYVAASIKNRPTSVLALTRLHTQAGLLLVSGYRGDGAGGKKARVEADNCLRDQSGHVNSILENERKRLAQDLHDEVGHDLVLIKMYLEMLVLEAKDCPDVQPRLTDAIDLVSQVIDSVRRIGFELGPAIFDELAFLPAVKSYIHNFSARTKIPVFLNLGHVPERIPMSHQTALYRLMQGALSNVLQHSSAKSVTISLGSMKDTAINMAIDDDGVGFDAKMHHGPRSVGLTAMRDRVAALAGKIHIRSQRAGPESNEHGTRIEIDLPLPGGGRR